MDEFLEYLKTAEGMRAEAEEIKKIQEKMDNLDKEIAELAQKEKELKNTPDKVETYKKRLEKLHEEIDKQNAIERRIERADEIPKLSKMINQKELGSKILEYFSTLYKEHSTVIPVSGMKVKVNHLRVSLDYNALLSYVQKYLPGHTNAYIQTIKKTVVDSILLYSNVISAVSESSIELITYITNKKNEIAESEVRAKILEGITLEGDRPIVTSNRLCETLSKLAIFEDILMEVKSRLLSDLHRISYEQIERYNEELFYGTVYHIEDIDTWYCDNLVQKIGEVCNEKKIEEITDAQKKGLNNRREMNTQEKNMSVLYLLSESLQKQKVLSISQGLLGIFQILERISSTKRAQKERIQKICTENVLSYFEKAYLFPDITEIKKCALQLADSQAVLGVLSLVADIADRNHAESAVNKNIAHIFNEMEEYIVDRVDESFSQLILCSQADKIDFSEESAVGKIDEIVRSFIETVDRTFTSAMLTHIKTMFYSRILGEVYYAIESDLEEAEVEHWRILLQTLLDYSSILGENIDFYSQIEELHRVFAYSGSATDFLEACDRSLHVLGKEMMRDLIPYVFSEAEVARILLNKLEKKDKKE
ncbi:hypothetical protein NEIG_01928 [Nematocida sp. ERTm5]|nr:hypothetical protein NEIG_01928 [Nematocida sp. ERTm5]